jgi:tRNA(fMet)-specific endonuclease VapC
MLYLLDTNVVIAVLNDNNSKTAKRLLTLSPLAVGISSIVIHELFYGAYKSSRRESNLALVDALRFEVVAFDQEDAHKAGQLRAFLSAKGSPIGPLDTLIAGQALARNLILVTSNRTEFARVPDLRVEDWS